MSTRVTSLLVLVAVLGATVWVFWVGRRLGGGERVQSEKPLVICNPPSVRPEQQTCHWTAHIHAEVRIFMKGEEVPLGFEQGTLEGAHTHAEPNKIHWHGLIPVDSQTKEVIDWSPLAVSSLALGPQEGKRTIIVNGKEVDPSYVWQDGDTIEIRY